MSRTVTGLFASRGEAEAARARLAATVKVESARVVAQDTAGALVGLPIEANQLTGLREALARGNHLVVATVARGADPDRIVSALTQATTTERPEDGPKLSYSIGQVASQKVGDDEVRPAPARGAVPKASATEASTAPSTEHLKAPSEAPVTPTPTARTEEAPAANAVPVEDPPVKEEAPASARPAAAPEREEVRIGTRLNARGGGASSSDFGPQSGFESRAPARRLTEEEVQAGGLLKDRVIEVVEMREEPVISREVVVREEVVIRKTVNERTETVNETVRHTEAEVEELLPR